MAITNRYFYGFRWSKAFNGGRALPSPVERFVATAYQANPVTYNCDLYVGDPVQEVNDGSVALVADGSNDGVFTGSPWGIIVGIKKYYDGSVITGGTYLPGGTTWTTDDQQATLLVVPITAGVWECCVDDATTATTKSAYQAYIGENVEGKYAATAVGKSYPKLDISSHATTYTLGFKIVGLSQSVDNIDYAGANISLAVVANRHTVAPFYSQATGV